jgi:hypothetical protein
MDQLAALLTAWIVTSHGLPLPPEPPRIATMTPVERAALHAHRSDGAPTVVGSYDTRDGTIYLTEGWDSADFVDVSVLVHELVHHLQDGAGRTHACPEEREALAYAVQAEWLAMFGQDLETAFGIDALTLKLRTQCLPW